MIDDRAARRYAQAAFDAAKSANAIASVENDLKAVSSIFESDPKLRGFILSPDIPRDRKHLAFDVAFRDANPLTKQLLKVMIDKRRESLMGVMATEFETLRREYETTVRALISSAQPLTDDEKTRLVAKMSAALDRRIEPQYKVDPGLVGGVRVTYEGYVLDGSVRGTFRRLRESLHADFAKQLSSPSPL